MGKTRDWMMVVMYIYWEDHLREVLDNEQYCVCNSEIWTQNNSELTLCYRRIPFSADVREVFELGFA